MAIAKSEYQDSLDVLVRPARAAVTTGLGFSNGVNPAEIKPIHPQECSRFRVLYGFYRRPDPNREKTGNPDCGPRQGAFGAILGAARTNIAPASSSNAKKMTPAAIYVASAGGKYHFACVKNGTNPGAI